MLKFSPNHRSRTEVSGKSVAVSQGNSSAANVIVLMETFGAGVYRPHFLWRHRHVSVNRQADCVFLSILSGS